MQQDVSKWIIVVQYLKITLSLTHIIIVSQRDFNLLSSWHNFFFFTNDMLYIEKKEIENCSIFVTRHFAITAHL